MDTDKLVKCMDAMARCIRTQVRVAGMQAENDARRSSGASPAYTEKDFSDVMLEEGIGCNDITELLYF